MTKTVALNVVVRNEEEGLRQLLELCAPNVDEVVVVHDGRCRDGSLKVARQFKARVHVGRLYKHAAPHRRVALALTESDWVFTCDPDEEPESRLVEDLRTLVNRPDVMAYTVRKVAYIDDVLLEEIEWYSLFRVLPSVQYSMLPHATHAPLGLAGKDVGSIVQTGYVVTHRKPASIHAAQRKRYERVIRPLLGRFGDVPSLRAHLERCLVMNPDIERICEEKGYPL